MECSHSYLLFLVFLLCQETNDVTAPYWRFCHRIWGAELLRACIWRRLSNLTLQRTPSSKFRVLRDTIFDEFFIGHILGWYGKAIALRNLPLLWAYSVSL